MTKYIENVNEYLKSMKIKQTYISLKTGIDKNKLSRILTGIQDVSSGDMEKISKALGQKTQFFLNDDFKKPEINSFMPEKIAFYAGEPTEEQEKFAEKLVEFVKNIDEVLSAKQRVLNLGKENV